jgi:hypothetical protein
MRTFPTRGRGANLLLAVLLVLTAAMPVSSLAAPAMPVAGGGAQADVIRVLPTNDRATVSRWLAPVRHADGRLAAIRALAAREAAAAQAAADAAKKAAAAKATAARATAPRYAGTNHFWIPSLGVSRSVSWFACTRSTPPANRIYRWGCAGRNNVYLFGHAWGVMKPVHDAYVAGKLKKGMVVVYADGNGRVRKYRVTEIRVVTPDKVDWAIAAQSKPSMTLQTCLGANSEKRLLVRLVADG